MNVIPGPGPAADAGRLPADRSAPLVRVELLVATDCAPCAKALAVWEDLCATTGDHLHVIDVASPQGRALFEIWHLGTVPAVLVGGDLMAVGVQTPEQALKLISYARRRDA